jgi:xanthine dehydrogenase/oxidase
VAVYHIDGSVIVAHGGIEMGQGINTKVAQTVAAFLDIPLEKIRVRPTSNFITPNSSLTAAGSTSESCCFVCSHFVKITYYVCEDRIYTINLILLHV